MASKFSVEFLQSVVDPLASGAPLLNAHEPPTSETDARELSAKLFTRLFTRTGFQNIHDNYRLRIANAVERSFDEILFLDFMRKATELPDYYILDLFDFLDVLRTGELLFQQFFLCLGMILARDAGCTTRHLHLQGKEVFMLLRGEEEDGEDDADALYNDNTAPAHSHAAGNTAPPAGTVSVAVLVRYCYLLSIPQTIVEANLGPARYPRTRQLDYAAAIDALYAVCAAWDAYVASNGKDHGGDKHVDETTALTGTPKDKDSKKKGCLASCRVC